MTSEEEPSPSAEAVEAYAVVDALFFSAVHLHSGPAQYAGSCPSSSS